MNTTKDGLPNHEDILVQTHTYDMDDIIQTLINEHQNSFFIGLAEDLRQLLLRMTFQKLEYSYGYKVIREKIKNTIECFHNDKRYQHLVDDIKVKGSKVQIPKIFEPYVTYTLFNREKSALVRSIPYLEPGHYVEKIDNVYYMTRNYANMPKVIVSQEVIDRFGQPEDMSPVTLFAFVYHMDMELVSFGI